VNDVIKLSFNDYFAILTRAIIPAAFVCNQSLQSLFAGRVARGVTGLRLRRDNGWHLFAVTLSKRSHFARFILQPAAQMLP
jgi:hypothetical protein